MGAGALSTVSHCINQRLETAMIAELMEQPLFADKVGSSK